MVQYFLLGKNIFFALFKQLSWISSQTKLVWSSLASAQQPPKEGAFVDGDKDKLDGIEASATADQTAIEIINLLNSDLGGDKQIGTQTDDKMTFGGSVTVTGDLQVNGTTTTVDSTTVNIGDNILELNYAGTAADAGILVKDAVGGANVSGSLLWDASEDYWIAGALGSEGRVIVGNGTDTAGKITKFSADGVITDSILSESGTTLTISNDVIVSGLTASQLVVTNGSKQLTSSTDISALTLTLDGGEF